MAIPSRLGQNKDGLTEWRMGTAMPDDLKHLKPEAILHGRLMSEVFRLFHGQPTRTVVAHLGLALQMFAEVGGMQIGDALKDADTLSEQLGHQYKEMAFREMPTVSRLVQ